MVATLVLSRIVVTKKLAATRLFIEASRDDTDQMPAGQVIGSIKQLLPARLIVESIVEEAREAILGLQRRLEEAQPKL